ncbi:MAG: beta strand repeat-containing protein [Akkermansiaceae bacterium]|jgi:fibronectin-binding autotransporter adhesin
MNHLSLLRHFYIACCLSVLAVASASAATIYWDGTTASWNTASNWSTASDATSPDPLVIPTILDDLIFNITTANGAGSITLDAAQAAKSLTFNNTDTTTLLGGGSAQTLTLGIGGITVGASSGQVTLGDGTAGNDVLISLSRGVQTWTNNSAANFTFNNTSSTFSRVAGSTLNFNKVGAGNFTVTSGVDNDASGIIGNWAIFGTGANLRYATVSAGNIVGLTGTTANTEGGWISSTGNYEVNTTTAQTLTASRTANTLRYSGTGLSISVGAAGANTLTLNGIMAVGASGALTITRSGTSTGTVVIGSSNELVITGNQNVSINAVPITGTGGVTMSGTGFLTLGANPAAAHTYSGPTILNRGVTMFGGNLSSASNLILNGGVFEEYWNTNFTRTVGTGAGQVQIIGGASGFSLNGATGQTVRLNNNATFELVWGSATFNPSTLVLQSQYAQNGSSLTFDNKIDLNGVDRTISQNATSTASATIAQAIRTSTGTAGIIKTGPGNLILSNTNTYNGNTTVNQGVLTATTTGALPGFGTAGRLTVASNATIAVRTGAWTAANIDSLRGAATWSATSSRLGIDTTAANFSYASNITEALTLNKLGANTLTLTGNNTYSGGTLLTTGTLSVGSDTAIPSTSTISFNGGTIQSSDATVRTLPNLIALNGDINVGTTGNLTFSNTGSMALGTSRTFTISGGTTTFAQSFTGSGLGITKAGGGILTLTGNNTFTGGTTISAGRLVLNNDGDVASSTVTFSGSNTGLTITGGSGVSSIWNNNNGNFGTSNNSFNNVQVLIDGAGTAGSARLTNVAILIWGKTATNSTLSLTNGGQMNVSGEVRIGDPYYSTNGGANITIGGGTATSTFTGNAAQAFYIGFGDRENSNNNVVTVNSGGVLTSVGNMFVGDVNNQQGNDLASTANRLTVTGTGTASMVSVTVGNARAAGAVVGTPEKADANVVQVTSGGTLTTSGANYIGRATANFTQANSNTITVSGAGSTWAAGNQNIFVGFTSNAGAASSNNILTVSSGGAVTGISGLTIGSGSGTETGNKVVINGGSVTATTVTMQVNNTLEFGVDGGTLTGNIVNNGSLSIGSNVDVSLAGNISGTTGTITQSGSGSTTLSGTNSYTGATTVNAGILKFTKMEALNNNVDTNWTAAKINVKSGAMLALNVDSAGTNGFTSAKMNTLLGNISVANTAAQGLQAGAILGFDTSTATGGTFTQGNAIADSTGSGAFHGAIGVTKFGTGTLNLDQINTYTGATSVNAGTLIINGTTSASSVVTVASGATLGGSGTVGGNTTISGIHSAGNSPGLLTHSGNLTYNSGASVVWELVANTTSGRGTNFDGINVSGALDFVGATSFNLVFNFSGSAVNWQDSFWSSSRTGTNGWLVYSGATSLSNFNNLILTTANWLDGSGQNFDTYLNGNSFSLYQDNNNVYLSYQAVPEPRAVLLSCLGLLFLLLRFRRH